jgi:hypothetical protein
MTPETPSRTTGVRPAAHLAAVILLGQAIAAGQAGFSPTALLLVGAAIAAITAALVVPETGGRVPLVVIRGVVVAGLALAVWRMPLVDLYIEEPRLRSKVGPFVLLAGLSVILMLSVVVRHPRAIQPACLPLLLTTFALMGAFYLGLAPDPKIDVYRFGSLGCDALLDGRNPYAITIPDPYGPNAHFYAAGVVAGGRILCGYCYPPLTLLLSLPAHLLAGDVRYADLAAMVLAAAIVAYGFRRRSEGTAVAVLLLFMPGGFHLLENAWTEPLLILLVALTTVLAARGWLRSAAVVAGLLLASKQYVPLAAPAFLLLVPRPWTVRALLRWVGIALAAGLVVTLPFMLWSPSAFFRSLTVLNVGVIRYDAISFLPPLLRATGLRLPLLVWPIAAAAVAGTLVTWRAPRTPAGFAAGFALICLCVFAVSPLAFGNYYALAVGSLCVSAAAEG